MERIQSLYEDELKASSALGEQLASSNSEQPSESYQDKLEIARKFLRVKKSGDFDNALSNWGHWGSIRLPTILAMQGQVIVDLKAIDPDDFPAEYGVRYDQFKTLAKERLIIPNVYEDGEMTREFLSTGKIMKSKYSKFSKLEELFDVDEYGTRILGLRREQMFQSFESKSQSQSERETKLEILRDLILPELKKESVTHWNKLLTGSTSTDHEGIAEKITNNFLYLELYGEQEDRAQLSDLVESKDLSQYNSIESLLKWARGRKTEVASPFTAAYGGTYNNKGNEEELSARYRLANHMSPGSIADMLRSKEEQMALARFFQELASIKVYGAWDIPEDPIDLAENDTAFESFIEAIKGKTPLLRESDLAIWKSLDLKVDSRGQPDFTNWSTFADITREIWAAPSDRDQKTVAGAVRFGAFQEFGKYGLSITAAETIGYLINQTLTALDVSGDIELSVPIAVVSGIIGAGGMAGHYVLVDRAKRLTKPQLAARRTLVSRVVDQKGNITTPAYLSTVD